MFIGIDLGGTKIAAGLADTSGKLLKKTIVPTAQTSDPTVILQQLVEVIKDLAKTTKKKIRAVGIGLPGQIDQGQVINMPNIPALKGFPLIKRLAKKFPAYRFVVDNDANAAAKAEHIYGAGKKYKNFIYITISTGIGAGIIINGQLFGGAHNTAGEVGHMVIVPGGPQCGCGNKGCWEAVGSGTAFKNMAKARLLTGEKSLLREMVKGDLEKIYGGMIIEAAQQGDALAKELLAVNGYYNALGITNLVHAFDPEAIIVGGGVPSNGKPFFDAVAQGLKMFQLLNPAHAIPIIPAKCKTDTGLLGALALVVR